MTEQKLFQAHRKSRSGSSAGMAGLGPGLAIAQWADDCWHNQRTPGGYESWFFQAIDELGTGVVVAFYDGFPFHPYYLHQLSRYRQRLAKTAYDPVWENILPSAYPVAAVRVFQNGKRVAQFTNQYAEGSFEGSEESPELRLGPNRITLRQDGSFGIVARGYPMTMTAGGPRHHRSEVLSVALDFVPTFRGVQAVCSARPASPNGARHEWIVAAPHGQVTGHVRHLNAVENVALLDMQIDTLGYHDHQHGGTNIGGGLKRWIRGRAMGERWTAVWQHAIPKSGRVDVSETSRLMIFQRYSDPIVIESPAVELSRWRVSPWGIRYPQRLSMHGSDTQGNSVELVVANVGVMEQHPYQVRNMGKARVTVVGKHQMGGHAVSEVSQTRRLLWPLINDLGIMAVLPVERDDPIVTQ